MIINYGAVNLFLVEKITSAEFFCANFFVAKYENLYRMRKDNSLMLKYLIEFCEGISKLSYTLKKTQIFKAY